MDEPSGIRRSPRPKYEGPSPIRADSVALHLWGDATAGEVADWIYLSNENLHHIVFGLGPGRAFRHSEDFRTIFAADELLYVLEGTLILVNPEFGEVHRVNVGEAVFFRRDTWHHAFNFCSGALRVVEFFAPPPETGASSAYARTKDLLLTPRYLDESLVGSWPCSKEAGGRKATLHVIRDDDDILWELAGQEGNVLVGIYVSTEHLTAGKVVLRPGGRSGIRRHGGDMSLQVLSGPIHVLLPDGGGPQDERWFELEKGDGFFVPRGTRYELFEVSGHEASLLFGVAPRYLDSPSVTP